MMVSEAGRRGKMGESVSGLNVCGEEWKECVVIMRGNNRANRDEKWIT